MLLRRGLAASALLLTTVCAQSSTTSADQTVITVFMIGAAGGGPEDDPTNLLASIIDNDDTATTMKIGCESKNPDDDTCNYFSGFDVINGPSTFRAAYAYNEMTMSIRCDIADSTTATCSQTIMGPAYMLEEDGPEITTQTADLDTSRVTSTLTTTTFASSDISYYPVTITAGALKTGGEDDAASSTTGASAASASAGSSDVSDARRVTLKASGGLAGFIALVMMAL